MYQNYYPAYQQQREPQNGGFVAVPTFASVENWIVAPGTSVTFLIESNPTIVCTKTKGLSQLEPPVIKIFDLVEREETPPETEGYATKAELAALAGVVKDVDSIIASLKSEISLLKENKDGKSDT